MQKIQRLSRILQILFLIALIGLPIMQISAWFLVPLPCQPGAILCAVPHWIKVSNTLDPQAKWLAWAIDLIPTLFEMCIFYWLIRLFKLYEKGEIFTPKNVRYLWLIGITFILKDVVKIFTEAFLSFILTFHDHGAAKYDIAISLSNHDLSTIFTGIIILLASWIMSEASKLQEEQSYTI